MISSEKKEAFSPLKFEVEVEMGMEMEMGHSWNERGYRLQHQHFQERPTINEKKTPRAECPVCSVSELMNYPKPSPPKKNRQLKSSPKPTHDDAP